MFQPRSTDKGQVKPSTFWRPSPLDRSISCPGPGSVVVIGSKTLASGFIICIWWFVRLFTCVYIIADILPVKTVFPSSGSSWPSMLRRAASPDSSHSSTSIPSSPSTDSSYSSWSTFSSLSSSSTAPSVSTIDDPVVLGDALPKKTKGTLERNAPFSADSSSTSSRTREKLRLAELENQRLRAETERLKREALQFSISSTKPKDRLQQLKSDARKAKANTSRPAADGLYKDICNTDLLFLMDTTFSMSGHINAAREQVMSIVEGIKKEMLEEVEVRIAVVGYKDHDDEPNIQFQDFTQSVEDVRSFISTFVASGGGDLPEDVLGGLQQALKASWKHKTRCIIHIADDPPHGVTNHDITSHDRYPTAGSEPHGLLYEPLLEQMVQLKINYALIRITDRTDRMAWNFLKAYAGVSQDCRLHPSNKYYNEPLPVTTTSSALAKAGGLLFQEVELGTDYSKLRHLVVNMVTTSSSRTGVRMSLSRETERTSRKNVGSKLISIEEDAAVKSSRTSAAQLDMNPPPWEEKRGSQRYNVTYTVKGFSVDVVVHGPDSLDAMMADDDNIKMSCIELSISKRLLPFAQGGLRNAFFATTVSSTDPFVVKTFKRDGKRLEHLAEDMKAQALCKAFALEFSAFLEAKHPIDFIVTTCFKGKPRLHPSRRSGQSLVREYMSLEPYVEGDYTKYNGNNTFVNKEKRYEQFSKAAQAFSHFTFERSKGRFLVNDLQGVSYTLTDPAIQTLDPERFKLSPTNFNTDGFKLFFQTHVCNDICQQLGLKSTKDMFNSGDFEFRASWPNINSTVYCSNKLCGKIVGLASARTSDEYAGYHWCDKCWPQLQYFKKKYPCRASGVEIHHEFEESRFFYESQGQAMPREYRRHRVKSVVLPRPVHMNNTEWDNLEPAGFTRDRSGPPSSNADPAVGPENHDDSPDFPSVSLRDWDTIEEELLALLPAERRWQGFPLMSTADRESHLDIPEADSSAGPEDQPPIRQYGWRKVAPVAEASDYVTKVKPTNEPEEDILASTAPPAEDGNLWRRMKTVAKRKSASFLKKL